MKPQKSSSQRSGTKCSTKMAPSSSTTASQVSSGTEKLNVLGRRSERERERVTYSMDLLGLARTYLMVLSPSEAR